MKKLMLSVFLTTASKLALADVVIEPPKKSPAFTDQPLFQLLLGVGVVALGILFYVRYRRAGNRP